MDQQSSGERRAWAVFLALAALYFALRPLLFVRSHGWNHIEHAFDVISPLYFLAWAVPSLAVGLLLGLASIRLFRSQGIGIELAVLAAIFLVLLLERGWDSLGDEIQHWYEHQDNG